MNVLALQSDCCPLRSRCTVGCEQPSRSPIALSLSFAVARISASSCAVVRSMISSGYVPNLHSIREWINVNCA